MPTGTLAPVARQQFLDANGNPLAAGQLFTYLSGTSTPSPIYTDSALLIPHPNPAILDAGGFLTIYMGAVSQKWILQSATNVVQWTVDPVNSVGLSSAGGDVLEVFEFGGDSTSPVTATTYPAGATVAQTHAGTALLVIDPATIPAGSYVLAAMIQESGGALVSVALVDLLAGAPNTPIAVASGTSTTGARVVSGVITFPAGGVSHTFAIKTQTASGAAFVWGVQLVKV